MEEEPLSTHLKWAYPNNPPAISEVQKLMKLAVEMEAKHGVKPPPTIPERPEVKKPSKLNKTPSNVEHLYKPEVLSPIYPTLPAYLADRNRVIEELRTYAKARAIEAIDLRRWARDMSRWSFDTIREFKKFLEPQMKELNDIATERHQAWVGQYHQAALAKYWEDRYVKAESEKEELKKELSLVKEKQHEEKKRLQRRKQLVEKAETGLLASARMINEELARRITSVQSQEIRDSLTDWNKELEAISTMSDLMSQWESLAKEQQLLIHEKYRWHEEMQTKEREYRWQIQKNVNDEAKREGEFNSISWQAGHFMGYTKGTSSGGDVRDGVLLNSFFAK